MQWLFGKSAKEIRTASRQLTFRYRSPAHFIEVLRGCYGPMSGW